MSVYTVNREQPSTSVPRVLAITGGKGGVGKTSLSVNIAIALSRNGSKVCLFDADMGLANINVMLGMHPAYTLEHLFTGEKSIQDIVVEGPEGIHIVPGASGFAQCVDLDVGQQQRLVSSIKSIEPHYDYMLVDTAAGISPTVLHFIAASQIAALVVTPEPTSLTDAFSLVKVLKRRGYKRKVQVIVNMATNSSQAEKVYRRFNHAVNKYLRLRTEYLGSVWMDESMRTAVTLQRPVALFPKHDPSARSFYRLAERIDDVFSQPGVPKLAFSAYWQKLLEAHASRKQKEFEQNLSTVGSDGAERSSPTKDLAPEAHSSAPLTNVVDISGQTFKSSDVSSDVPTSVSAFIRASSSESRVEGANPSAEKPSSSENLTQVQRQLDDQARNKALQAQLIEAQAGAVDETGAELDQNDQTLNQDSEQNWIDLRVGLNALVADENTTPEQVTTLLSSLVFGFGDRLGTAAVDVIQGMLAAIEPSSLDDEHKLTLLNEMHRLGVLDLQQTMNDEIIEVTGERYDSQGFGCQQDLAQQIRSSSGKVPLENLLESIKYASLVDVEKDS